MEKERESLFEWVTRVLRDPDPAGELARLGARTREALDDSLAPGETIRVLLRGAAGQAIAGTDARVLVVSSEVSCWSYLDVIGVDVKQRVVGGSVVLRVAGGEA